jgi:3-methyladenine DNA glycosylase AlkD
MDHSAIQQAVQQAIANAIDSAYLANIQALVPSGWTIQGVRVPQLRTLATGLRQAHKAATVEEIVTLLDQAFAAKTREPVLVYLFWLAHLQRHLTPARWPMIDRWVDLLADWEICDQLATGIAAPLVAQQLTLVDELVRWTASPNLWRRRFPPAVASALNQKGRAQVAATLRICAPLLNDPEAMVRKAVGWALREASDHDAATVYAFLLEHKDKTARTVLSESSKKLSEAQRAKLVG